MWWSAGVVCRVCPCVAPTPCSVSPVAFPTTPHPVVSFETKPARPPPRAARPPRRPAAPALFSHRFVLMICLGVCFVCAAWRPPIPESFLSFFLSFFLSLCPPVFMSVFISVRSSASLSLCLSFCYQPWLSKADSSMYSYEALEELFKTASSIPARK